MEAAPDAIVVVNREREIVLVNTQVEKLFGYKREELLNSKIEILIPEALRDKHHGLGNGFFATHRTGPIGAGQQLFARRKDGSEFQVEVRLSPLETDEGTLVMSVVRDITHQIRAEEKLLRYEAIVEWSNDAIIVLGLDGVITNWNMGAERIFGFAKSEAVGKPITILTPPGRHEEPLNFLEGTKKGVSLLDFETVRMRKDGKLVDVSITLSPIRNRDGQIVGGSGVVRDISELKRAEERFRKTFNASPEPITVATFSEGRYIDVNESFLRVTGFQRDEVIGRTSLELGVWKDPEERAKLVELLQTKKVVRDFEQVLRTKSGEKRTGLTSYEVIDIAGEKCIISIIKDITERLKFEEQLRQSQKMESIGLLAGGIAHDFNNLLNVIFGYSDLLLEDVGSDSPYRDKIREIKRAGEQGASLVRQLLAFSRRQILDPRTVNLNDVVQNMETMLRRVIGEDIELVSRMDPEAKTVMVDPGQMGQVILNLVINARDAMPHGGRITLEITNATLDAEHFVTHGFRGAAGEYVMLSVSDTGTGMDETVRKQIFEPFFTTKGPGKGTGLGLSTVYGIVKQSGGYIFVYSEVGRGTAFKVYFPQNNQKAHAPAAAAAARKPPQEEVKCTETILIVEDDEAMGTMLHDFLNLKGYTVLKAVNGGEAIQIAKSHAGPIALVITDVIMPEMSGPEMVVQFSKLLSRTKVLYASGYTRSAISHDGVLDPGITFVQKPYSLADLHQKIRSLLQ